MKNLNKLILTGALVAMIPFALNADDRDRDHHDYDRYESHHFDDKVFAEKFKDANYEFEGRVDKRPTKSLSGTWVISGITVLVNDNTFISHSDDKIEVGDDVEVLAKRENGKVTALDLNQEH